jgi:ribosome-binding factor A
MATQRRKVRLESLILREISSYLMKDVQNPHIGFTSIIRVELNRDLTHAKVFVSILGSEQERQNSFKALQTTTSYLQFLLGKNLKIRSTPILHFILSDSIKDGDEMSNRLSPPDEE